MPNSLSLPLKVGDAAPGFVLPDPLTDSNVSLAEFVGKDTLVVFFRGTWCPFCRQQMALLRENSAALEQAGIALVGIVCQNKSPVQQYLKQHPLPFPLLADETRTVAKAYGAHYWFSLEGINLAQPSLFILDTTHHITYAHVGRNMADLPMTYVLEKFIRLLPT